jgi:hypothetical protein
VYQLLQTSRKRLIQLGGSCCTGFLLIPVKLANVIKVCPNEIFSRVRVGKHLSDTFSVKNGFKEGGL